MGYDCTLHAVDENQITKAFVKMLLAGEKEAGQLESGIEPELWEQTLKSLEKDPPPTANSTVCQLALIFASKTQPYHYERGFALCLWPEQSDGLDARFPEELTDSPEILFTGLLKKYPHLKGNSPREFSGNWSTGTFIASKKIAKALKWVEEKVQKYEEGDRKLFRGLILVLKHCAKNKLAYWEGTDLGLPLATMSVEGSESRRAERAFKWPDYGYEPLAQQGCTFICEYRLGPSKESRTALADFSKWPPMLEWLPEHTVHAAISSESKLLTIAAEPGKYFYTIRLRDRIASQLESRPLLLRSSEFVGENGYDWADFFESQIIGLVQFKKDKTSKRYPLFYRDGVFEENTFFRPANDNHQDHWGMEWIRFGIAKTGAGAQIFIWGEHGYELCNGAFEKRFTLVEGRGPDWFSVPSSSNGFFYLSNSRLYEIHQGEASIHHLPKLENIMHLRSGPEGSLLLKEGDNKAGDWGKLYWPHTKQLTRLKPDMLRDIPEDDLRELYWLEDQKKLLAFSDREVWFVPLEEIQKLPRTKA